MAAKNQSRAQRAWPQATFSKLQGELGVPLIIVAIYSIVCLIIYGNTGNQYLFMLVGSILSMAGIFAFVMASFSYGALGKKSFVAMLMTFAGFIPYLFGVYLTFYQGFWGFKELSTGFSIWLVVKSLGAIVLGFWIVNKTYQITEEEKKFTLWVKSDPDLIKPVKD
jgi:hypothetical protein